MTIELPEPLKRSILKAVDSGRYESLDDAMTAAAHLLVERLIQEETVSRQPETSHDEAASSSPHKLIWEEIEDLYANVPDDEFLGLPVDGAEQHDHYIHGTPKRPPEP